METDYTNPILLCRLKKNYNNNNNKKIKNKKIKTLDGYGCI